ncbi:MAG: alcohol dehydrogenase catalytic domain-containing protein [Cohaesibacter sp.]|nr:alcohol dehydrogenase catalytic domain-containing protein [Cohaesibacter sp.]
MSEDRMSQSSTMKAAILMEPGHFEVREVPKPHCGPDEVLIKVERVGICGTDVHIFHGNYAADKLPLIPGHELVGTIEQLGETVQHLDVGSRVVVDINVGCGQCYYCRRNEILNCAEVNQLGISCDGAFAEYLAVPARLVIPVSEHVPVEVAALCEPVACVVRATRKANIGFGQSVVVLGGGPIGNLHVQMLRLVGAAPIVVAEPNEMRAQLALDAGADVVVSDSDQLKETVLSMTDGRGADVVIESVGLPALYEKALDLIRPGGHISAFGITGPDDALSMSILDMILKENSIKGSVAGMGEDMHDALTLLSHNRFKTDAFASKAYKLEDIQAAFEGLADHIDVLKTSITVS